MEKAINIDGKKVGFRASALTPRLYRHKMGRDIVRDLNALDKAYKKAVESQHISKPGPNADAEEVKQYEEKIRDAQLTVTDLEIFENVAFIMARQYDPSIAETPEEWLESFNVFSIYEILPEILQLWGKNQQTTAKPKKK